MKTRTLVSLVVILLLNGCGSSLTNEKASEVIKTTFHLGDLDQVEVIGIAKESDDIMLVKFKLNNDEVSSKMRKYDKGWQLDEVQNRLGGWIPVSTVSSQFDPTEKIKIALVEMSTIAIGLTDYITDHGSFPSLKTITAEGIKDLLSPFYIRDLPTTDPWQQPYWVLMGKLTGFAYGISSKDESNFLIYSKGSDGVADKWNYDPNNELAGLFDGQDPTKDLVNYNGQFIRAPKTLVNEKGYRGGN